MTVDDRERCGHTARPSPWCGISFLLTVSELPNNATPGLQ
jgi:hypothetical protein